MSPLRFIRSLTPLVRWIIFGLLAVLLIGVAALVQSWRSSSTAKTEANLSRNQIEAALESGADAVGTIGKQSAAEDATDTITRENENAIRSAPGADTPVPAAVDAVARERLCRRAAYSQRPECLQYAPAD